MATKLFSSLNPQQLKAVTLPEESALILAGAGTGKTRVITERIIYLLDKNLACPSEILALTFTNKAANEMVKRLKGQIAIEDKSMWVCTFHGLCNRLLRQHYEEVGLSESFTIIDSPDQTDLIVRVMKENDLYGRVRSVAIQKRLEVDFNRLATNVKSFINKSKTKCLRANQIKPALLDPIDVVIAEAGIYSAYEAEMKRLGVADFSELLLLTYELLKKNASLRHYYQERFRYILVDEFQDTDTIQYELIKLLSGLEEPNRKRNAVFVVGDDDQSIYSFRGAKVENMQYFLKNFDISGSNLIRLEQNYRSSGCILRAANSLIEYNKNRVGKNLRTQRGAGETIKVFRADDVRKEANYVVENIRELIKNGEEPQDIAVLYRVNAQSAPIEAALVSRHIDYLLYGSARFCEREEVKNALAYLRLAQNPNDDVAFYRVVNVPSRGITEEVKKRIEEYSKANNCSLFESAQRAESGVKAKLKPFLDIIEDIRNKAEEVPLPQLVEYSNEHSGLYKVYGSEYDAEQRQNIEALAESAYAFIEQEYVNADEEENSLAPLTQFLSQTALEPGDVKDRINKNVVRLMTIHAAKGLEFKNVFIVGLDEYQLPSYQSVVYGGDAAVEEERRMMYVAITRAKNRLFISYPEKRISGGMVRDRTKSRFLSEISPYCLEEVQIID